MPSPSGLRSTERERHSTQKATLWTRERRLQRSGPKHSWLLEIGDRETVIRGVLPVTTLIKLVAKKTAIKGGSFSVGNEPIITIQLFSQSVPKRIPGDLSRSEIRDSRIARLRMQREALLDHPWRGACPPHQTNCKRKSVLSPSGQKGFLRVQSQVDDSIGREIRECAGQSGKGFAPPGRQLRPMARAGHAGCQRRHTPDRFSQGYFSSGCTNSSTEPGRSVSGSRKSAYSVVQSSTC